MRADTQITTSRRDCISSLSLVLHPSLRSLGDTQKEAFIPKGTGAGPEHSSHLPFRRPQMAQVLSQARKQGGIVALSQECL